MSACLLLDCKYNENFKCISFRLGANSQCAILAASSPSHRTNQYVTTRSRDTVGRVILRRRNVGDIIRRTLTQHSPSFRFLFLQASKMGLAGTHPSGLPFFCPNGDHLTQPPPAHMGIPPYGALDAGKAAAAGEYWPSVTHRQPPTHAPWKRLLAAAASTGQPRAARLSRRELAREPRRPLPSPSFSSLLHHDVVRSIITRNRVFPLPSLSSSPGELLSLCVRVESPANPAERYSASR